MSKLSKDNLNLIEEIGNIGNTHMFISTFSDNTDTMLNYKNEDHNINVAIASSITALARVEMTKFKNNPLLKLYYTDTDSIFINLSPEQLDFIIPNSIGKNIGQLKLEYIIKRAIFLGPKAYYLDLLNNPKPVIKIKGLNTNVIKNAIGKELTFDKFYSLLFKDEFGPVGTNIKEGIIMLIKE